MSANVAHEGLTPRIGETFSHMNSTQLIMAIDGDGENMFWARLKDEGGYEDWYELDSRMLVDYALTRRPGK